MNTMNAIAMCYWSSLGVLLLLLLVTGQQPPAHSMKKCEVRLFRLPMRVQPSKYTLFLELKPSSNTFSGKVEIDLDIKAMDSEESLLARNIGKRLDPLVRDPRNIILNADKLEVVDVKFEQGGHSLGQADICHDKNNKILVVKLDRAPSLGVGYKLVLKFNGEVRAEAKGLFRSSIGSSHALATHFKPAYARRLFPCFDEPQFKATFDLTILHPEGTIALSNMPIRRYAPDGFGLVRTEYERTPKMSSYLLGLAVGDFDLIESGPLRDGKNIVIYAPKGWANSAGYMPYEAVQVYNKVRGFFVDLPQPLDEIKIVAVNMKHDVVENWGLITMRFDHLITSNDPAKLNERNYAVAALMNVMVRFWLGNLVTVCWWNELWFMEGLANYLTHELTAEQHPGIGTELLTLMDTTYSAMNDDDNLKNSSPIRGARLRTAEEVEKSYDSMTYKKSEAVFRMFAGYIGKDKFNMAILSFIEARAYEPVVADNWLEALSSHAPNYDEMQTMFRQWTEQAGYPVITARKIASGKLVLKQHSNFKKSYIWTVPIKYKLYGRSPYPILSKVFVLSEKVAQTIDLTDLFDLRDNEVFIKLNADFQGYYRVLYRSQGDSLKNSLIRAIETHRMKPIDQLQLLSDYCADAKRSQSVKDLENVLGLFSRETDDGVMLLLTTVLTELHDMEWSLHSRDLVTGLMLNYYTLNGGIRMEAGSNVLKQHAQSSVLYYLVVKLKNHKVIVDAKEYRAENNGLPPFIERILKR